MPLTKLLKRTDTPHVWNQACTEVFYTLKKKLVSAPILIAPSWEKTSKCMWMRQMLRVGAVLSEKDKKGHEYPIYLVSCQLVQAERNNTVIERKTLGMIFSMQKFKHYVLGYKFVFHVDHDALKFMINKPQLSGRIAR